MVVKNLLGINLLMLNLRKGFEKDQPLKSPWVDITMAMLKVLLPD